MKVLHLETGRYRTAIRTDGVVFFGHPPEAAGLVAFAELNGAAVFRHDGFAFIDVGWLENYHAKNHGALAGLAMAVKNAKEAAAKQPGFLQLN